ncbi:hypothetical protein HU200_012610 [Digitaria exilis]|uniref:Uncharacterized protein n=1 Tax=Digitaria exilis TaxID=1010633 RepID=A0A835FEE7_9POAL|nr:hypothetical protein HU200_012610 [Digitaria exilis]
MTQRQVLIACKTDADLWRHRISSKDRVVCDQRCNLFSMAM